MNKFEPEEFIVEEITEQGEVLELDKKIEHANEELKNGNYFFSQFVLQKRLWTTSNAIREIAYRLHISGKRINYGGNKDRNAITTQLCSAFAVEPSKILGLSIKDIKINGAWVANEGIRLGKLAGNRFTITLTEKNTGKEDFKKLSAKKIEKKLEKNKGAIPNYFGEQRFGSARKNTAVVGKLLILGKFKEALMNYLYFTDENERDEKTREARRRLEKERDFHDALGYFPYFLKPERAIIAHLDRFPNDYLGAFRKLHRSLQLLFIHAYQSELFNKMLESRAGKKAIKPEIGDFYCAINGLGFPEDEKPLEIAKKNQLKGVGDQIKLNNAALLGKIIGYQTQIAASEEKILKKEGFKKEDFILKSLPELSSKGAMRPLFVFLKEFKAREEGQGEDRKIVLRFTLPSGSYATVALKEIIS